jgi:hypothetical protein
MNFRNHVKTLLTMCGDALLSTVRHRLEALERQVQELNSENVSLAESQHALLEASIQIAERVVGQVAVETSDYEFANPETGLLDHLYSYLPSRRAIDAGARTGDVSERLLRSGYEVYAFQPLPPDYEQLVSRLGERQGFHPFSFALGGEPGRTLADLHREGIIPADLGLVMMDPGGSGLEVILGRGDFRYPVVCAQFSGAGIPLDAMIGEMRNSGYLWHIVLYRLSGREVTAFYCNRRPSIPESWGNVFFFGDYRLFSQGQAWCAAVLPRTYFKALP